MTVGEIIVEETIAPAIMDILTFRVGPFLLGVDVGQVAWLSRVSQGEFDSGTDGALKGIRLLDLRCLCGLAPVGGAEQRRVLVVKHIGDKLGYVVDEVADLIKAEVNTQIQPLPPLVNGQKSWQQLWGVCRWREELVLLVDLEYELPSIR
jgi:chemotaxis signal transduction protein